MTAAQIPGVALPRFLLDGYRAELDAAAKDRAELLADDDPALLDGARPNVEVAVTGIDEDLLRRLLEGPDLRWVHSVSAGVEHLPLASMAERGVLLTNSAGAYATAMAEYALAAMIMLARNLPGWLDGQRERRWLDADAFEAHVLRDKRLGIVGYGAVGRELAASAEGARHGGVGDEAEPVVRLGRTARPAAACVRSCRTARRQRLRGPVRLAQHQHAPADRRGRARDYEAERRPRERRARRASWTRTRSSAP